MTDEGHDPDFEDLPRERAWPVSLQERARQERHRKTRATRVRDLDTADRQQVLNDLFVAPMQTRPYLIRFGILLALSVIIATFGLIEDSTAVVIGAMLIAPLMTPILAVAASVAMGWTTRLLQALALVAVASAGSVLLAWFLSLIFPSVPTALLPEQVLMRTSPSLLDLGIGLAAGVAGAYVNVRRTALSALPGVAVAVALVPPLASAGILAEQGQWTDMGGALLLFLTNFGAIIVAGAFTFLATGFTPPVRREEARSKIRRGLVIAIVFLAVISIPLGLQAYDEYRDARALATVSSLATEWAAPQSLVVTGFDDSTNSVIIDVAGPAEPAGVDDLASELAKSVDETITLEVRYTPSETATAKP